MHQVAVLLLSPCRSLQFQPLGSLRHLTLEFEWSLFSYSIGLIFRFDFFAFSDCCIFTGHLSLSIFKNQGTSLSIAFSKASFTKASKFPLYKYYRQSQYICLKMSFTMTSLKTLGFAETVDGFTTPQDEILDGILIHKLQAML